MGFLVSPGVEVNEIDLTNVIPAVSTSIGGYAGHFNWGPSGELITVTSENELQSTFGTPDGAHSVSFLVAASFLKYGNALKVSRAINSLDRNAVAGSSSAAAITSAVNNLGEFENLSASSFGSDNNESFVARCPGDAGNKLQVIVGHDSSFVNANFDFAPGTSDYADTAGVTGHQKDEIHVLVLDKEGYFTGTIGAILEKYQGVSLAADAKLDNGNSNYYKDVINKKSQFIFVNSLIGQYDNADKNLSDSTTNSSLITFAEASSPSVTSSTGASTFNFSGGVTTAAGTSEVIEALELFADAETVDVNLLFASPLGEAAKQKLVEAKIVTIIKGRKDVVGFGSAPVDLHTNGSDSAKMTAITGNTPTAKSNYFVTTGSSVQVYNKYLDRMDYITTSGYAAGLCANTDDVADPWFSPAGFTRGQLLGVSKLVFNPNGAHRDTLYKAAINPITQFPGQGIVLFGDKTHTMKPSAFDRINVRRLFLVLEKAIATAAKFQLFELNDEFTRAMFRNMVEPFLRDVKGRRGITDFLVVCDETNNTGNIIDTNRFVADIYIKPARSINFITLNFIATRTGVEFSEVVGTN